MLEQSFLHTTMKIIMIVYYWLRKLISTLGSVTELRGFILNCLKETLLPMTDTIILKMCFPGKELKCSIFHILSLKCSQQILVEQDIQAKCQIQFSFFNSKLQNSLLLFFFFSKVEWMEFWWVRSWLVSMVEYTHSLCVLGRRFR